MECPNHKGYDIATTGNTCRECGFRFEADERGVAVRAFGPDGSAYRVNPNGTMTLEESATATAQPAAPQADNPNAPLAPPVGTSTPIEPAPEKPADMSDTASRPLKSGE